MASDFLDDAAEQTEFHLQLALQRRCPELRATGICYNCREPLPEGARFCDADCRDDYERRRRFIA